MRKFIRHPTDIPLQYSLRAGGEGCAERLHNVSAGGLCFKSDVSIEVGTEIHIRIPVRQPAFELDAVVVWCAALADRYLIGVCFDEKATAFSVRMVEQICYIEQYRRDAAAKEGRRLTADQAASEWITKYAAKFPV